MPLLFSSHFSIQKKCLFFHTCNATKKISKFLYVNYSEYNFINIHYTINYYFLATKLVKHSEYIVNNNLHGALAHLFLPNYHQES